MKKIIGGSIAVILGLLCFSAFFSAFFNLMAIVISLILLIAGCLTIYFKRESAKDTGVTTCCNNPDITDAHPPAVPLKTVSSTIEPKPIETEVVEIKSVETDSAETKSVNNGIEEKNSNTCPDDTPKLLGNTGTLVFHNFDCNFAKSKKCTAAFNTSEEAIQEGYKPCGTCKPQQE
jgi:hypothetical protein